MRSAETSGVGAKGFGVHQHARQGARAELGHPLAQAVDWISTRLSPVSIAIAATALVAATLSVATDAARTYITHQEQQRQIMHVATAEPAARWHYAGGVMTTLAGPADAGNTYLGVLHRGAGAFALALGITALTLRRRRNERSAPAGSQNGYVELLATMPFGAPTASATMPISRRSRTGSDTRRASSEKASTIRASPVRRATFSP